LRRATCFVEDSDEILNPLGVKGVGKMGLPAPRRDCEMLSRAKGKHVRDPPITLDRIWA
jgi:xanthine dehydrogenase YagR molybdenum-binding subunit